MQTGSWWEKSRKGGHLENPGVDGREKGKGRFQPGRGHESPDGERKYGSTLSLTSGG